MIISFFKYLIENQPKIINEDEEFLFDYAKVFLDIMSKKHYYDMFTKDEYLPNEEELFEIYKNSCMEQKRYDKNQRKKIKKIYRNKDKNQNENEQKDISIEEQRIKKEKHDQEEIIYKKTPSFHKFLVEKIY